MRRICLVTGSRAEYGLLRRLIKYLNFSDVFALDIVVTGSHLSNESGYTISEIIEDGFTVDDTINIQISGESGTDIAKSMGVGMLGFGDYFRRKQSDLLIVMGDRYEILSVALTAFMAGIPIAHISGGELSRGSKDDVIRHLLTKMSSLHFVSAEEHRKRVIQLGENPQTVFNVGEPGLDELRDIELLDKSALEKQLGVELNRKLLLMTFHPSGLNAKEGSKENDVEPLLRSLDAFPDHLVLCSLPNSDEGGARIEKALWAYQQQNSDRFHLFASHGRQVYLSLVAVAELVLGNSSSGLVEVPVLNVPSVDVGNRQRDRLRGDSVVHALNDTEKIVSAMLRAMSASHRKIFAQSTSPYGDGTACRQIVDILESMKLEQACKHDFFDLDFDLPEGNL